MGEHGDQAEYEREVGGAVIEDAQRQGAAALALWERNRRVSVTITTIRVAVIGVMAFITLDGSEDTRALRGTNGIDGSSGYT